jgi:hypothetical protein
MPRIFKPAGVTLSDPDDHDFHRQDIFTKVHEAVKQTFPKVHAGVRLELAGVF